ncbi:hypothetical protein Pcinc_030238 [Petrolisthes cinctipes]|uniref:USP domain-containing protein n=1 Tax=Petrolisthes cinctipes TaxID=88211 RepID=A0AAE1EZ93_PETCI|nr:hypothetical protein Pcinc_030238 [Petrolisthes cinctipes]
MERRRCMVGEEGGIGGGAPCGGGGRSCGGIGGVNLLLDGENGRLVRRTVGIMDSSPRGSYPNKGAGITVTISFGPDDSAAVKCAVIPRTPHSYTTRTTLSGARVSELAYLTRQEGFVTVTCLEHELVAVEWCSATATEALRAASESSGEGGGATCWCTFCCFAMAELQGRLLAYARAGDAGGVEATLRGGAGLDTPGMDSEYPGRCAIHHASASGHVDVVRLLISWGTDVNLVSRFDGDAGGRPAHLAAEAGYTRTLMDLLEAGADPFYYDNHGFMPLHRAAARGRWRVLKVFKYYGYDLSIRAADWSTALHLAAACGNLRLVTWLVHNGVRPDLADKHGRTALCHPQVRFHKEVQDYLFRVCRSMYCDSWVDSYFPSDYYMGQYQNYHGRHYTRQNRPYSRPQKVSTANQATSSTPSDKASKAQSENFPMEKSITSSGEGFNVDQTTNSALSEPQKSTHTEASSILTQTEPQIKLLEGLQSTKPQTIMNTLKSVEPPSQQTVSKPWPLTSQESQREPWQMDVMNVNHSGDNGECPLKTEVWENDYLGEDLDVYQDKGEVMNVCQLEELSGQWKTDNTNKTKKNEQVTQNNECLYQRQSVISEDIEKNKQQNNKLKKSIEDENSNKVNNNHHEEIDMKAIIPKGDLQKESEEASHQKLQTVESKSEIEDSRKSSYRKHLEQDMKAHGTGNSKGTSGMKEIVTVGSASNIDNAGSNENEKVTSVDYYKNKERKKGKEKALHRMVGEDREEPGESSGYMEETGISDGNHLNGLMKEPENNEHDKSVSFDSMKKTKSSVLGKTEATMLNGSLHTESEMHNIPLTVKSCDKKNTEELKEKRYLPDKFKSKENKTYFTHDAINKGDNVKKNKKERVFSNTEASSQPKPTGEITEISENHQTEQNIKAQKNSPEHRSCQSGTERMENEGLKNRDMTEKGVSQNMVPDKNENITVLTVTYTKEEKSVIKDIKTQGLTENNPIIKENRLSNETELVEKQTEPKIKSKADEHKFLPAEDSVKESQKELCVDLEEHFIDTTTLSRPASDYDHKATHRQKSSEIEYCKQENNLHQPDVTHTQKTNLHGVSRNEDTPSRDANTCVSNESRPNKTSHKMVSFTHEECKPNLIEDEKSQKENESLKMKPIKDKKKVPLLQKPKIGKTMETLKKNDKINNVSKNQDTDEKKENDTLSGSILNGEHEKKYRNGEDTCKLGEKDNIMQIPEKLESKSKRKFTSDDSSEAKQLHVPQNMRATTNKTDKKEFQEVISNVPETDATRIKPKAKEQVKQTKDGNEETDLTKKTNNVNKNAKKEKRKIKKTCGSEDTLLSLQSSEKPVENGTAKAKEHIQPVEAIELKPEQCVKEPEEMEGQCTKDLESDRSKKGEHNITELTKKENRGSNGIHSEDKRMDNKTSKGDELNKCSLKNKKLDSELPKHKQPMKDEPHKQDLKVNGSEAEHIKRSKAVKELGTNKKEDIMPDDKMLEQYQGEGGKTKKQKKDRNSKKADLKESGKKEDTNKNCKIKELEGKMTSLPEGKGDDCTVKPQVEREQPTEESNAREPKVEKEKSTKPKLNEALNREKLDKNSPVTEPKHGEFPNQGDEIKISKDQPKGEKSKSIIASLKTSESNALHKSVRFEPKAESTTKKESGVQKLPVVGVDQKANVKMLSYSEDKKTKEFETDPSAKTSLEIASEAVVDKAVKKTTKKAGSKNTNEKCGEQSHSESETEKQGIKQSSKSRRKDKQRKHLQMQRIQLSFSNEIQLVKDQKHSKEVKMEDRNPEVPKEKHIKSREKDEQTHKKSKRKGRDMPNSESSLGELSDKGMSDAETLRKEKKKYQSTDVSDEQKSHIEKKTKGEGKQQKKKQRKNRRGADTATKQEAQKSELPKTGLDQHTPSDSRLAAQVKDKPSDKKKENLNDTSTKQELKETKVVVDVVDEKGDPYCAENEITGKGNSEEDQKQCDDAQVEKLGAESNSEGVQGENRNKKVTCDIEEMPTVSSSYNQTHADNPREADEMNYKNTMKNEGKPVNKSEKVSREKEDELIIPHNIGAYSEKCNGTDMTTDQCPKLIPEEPVQENEKITCKSQLHSVDLQVKLPNRYHEYQVSSLEERKATDIRNGIIEGDEASGKCTLQIKSTFEEISKGSTPSDISDPKENEPPLTKEKEKVSLLEEPKMGEPPVKKTKIDPPVQEPKEGESLLTKIKENEILIKEPKKKKHLIREINKNEQKVKETKESKPSVRKTKKNYNSIKEEDKRAEVNDLKTEQPKCKIESSQTSENAAPNAVGKDITVDEKPDANILELPQELSKDLCKVLEEPTINSNVKEVGLPAGVCEDITQRESSRSDASEVTEKTALDDNEVSIDLTILTSKVAKEPATNIMTVTQEPVAVIDNKTGHEALANICWGKVELAEDASWGPQETHANTRVPGQEPAILACEGVEEPNKNREVCSSNIPFMESKLTEDFTQVKNKQERPSALDSMVAVKNPKEPRDDFSAQELTAESGVRDLCDEPVELIVDNTQATCSKEKLAINASPVDADDPLGNSMLTSITKVDAGENFADSVDNNTRAFNDLKEIGVNGESVPEENHIANVIPGVKKAETNEGVIDSGLAHEQPTALRKVDEDQEMRMTTKDDVPVEGQAPEYIKSSTDNSKSMQNIGKEELHCSEDSHITSIVQCFFSLPAIRNYFTSDTYRSESGPACDQGRGQVAKALADVFKALATGSDTISPLHHLRMLLGSQAHSGSPINQPQDCPFALLSTLLAMLHCDLLSQSKTQEPTAIVSGQCRVRDTSVISEWFQCMMETRYTCEKSFSVSRSRKPISVINIGVPVNSRYSLQELVVRQPQPECVKWDCPACNVQHLCRHQNWFVRTPPLLILHVSRRECQDKDTASPTFLTEYLNLHDIMLPSSAQRNVEYQLQGMISTTFNHHTAAYYYDSTSNAWTRYQNSNATKTDINTVLSERNAVVLFYVAQK